MKRRITPAMGLAVAAVLAAGPVSGCTSAKAKATPTIAVLVSPGAGETYSPDFKQVVEYTSDTGGRLMLASTDAGQTRSVFDESLAGDGANALQREKDQARKAAEAANAFRSISTAEGRSDPMRAFVDLDSRLDQVAHDGVSVVVFGEAIPKSAPLDLTDAKTLANPSASVNAALRVTDLDCRGWTVYLIGAAPGRSAGSETRVRDAWAMLTQGCGGTLRVYSPELSAFPAERSNIAPIKARPEEHLPVGQAAVLSDSELGFKPDSAELRDRDHATALLSKYADYLAGEPTRHLTITGTTSSDGQESGRLDLSRRRAAAVKALLVQLGASSEQIESDGVGTHYAGFINDRRDDGSLDSNLAIKNRNVLITLDGSNGS
jgi:outer membrane protein OmpA-like peptidoglycan-associated protein